MGSNIDKKILFHQKNDSIEIQLFLSSEKTSNLDEKNLKEENISKNTRTNADIIDYLRSLGFSVKYSINKNGIVFVAVSIKKEQFKKLAIKSKEWHL